MRVLALAGRLRVDCRDAIHRQEQAQEARAPADVEHLERLGVRPHLPNDPRYQLVALELVADAGLQRVVTVSMEREGRMTLDGFGPGECAARLVDAGADVVGINCLQRPADILRCAVEMHELVGVPICCQPSAWHSWWSNSRSEEPEDFAEFARAGMAAGIGYLGSCCGAGPEHVRAMAEAMGKLD